MRSVAAAVLSSLVMIALLALPGLAAPPAGEGWTPLFDGKDLSAWKVPPGGEKHWKVVDGVLDYDARSGTLWTKKPLGDFTLHIEWRLKTAEELYGSKTDKDGKPWAYYPDSGIFLRGTGKAQTNLWPHPMGSGEVWGFRTDKEMPEEVRKACVPKVNADKPSGEWNVQEITMKGDHLTVVINGQQVIDTKLPGVPKTGPIGLQQHGGYIEKTKQWRPASACLQFRNIYVKQ